MTIRLLSTYDGFPPNSIITIDPALEAAFIAAQNATADLTGGVVAYRERKPLMVQPAVKQRGSVNLIANRKAFVPLSEGAALAITPTAGTTGTYQRYDVEGTAVGNLMPIGTAPITLGPYEGDLTVEIKCTTGSMSANATTRPPQYRQGANMAFIGDSQIARAFGYTNTANAGNIIYTTNANGWVRWALGKSGQAFSVGKMVATPSTGSTSFSGTVHPTSQEQLATVLADPKITDVFFSSAINDLQADCPVAVLTAAQEPMFDAILASGRRLHVATCMPMNSTYGGYTAARQGNVLAYNTWLRNLVAKYGKNAELYDFYAVVVNEASKTSSMKTNYSQDNLHLRNLGAYVLGSYVAARWKAQGRAPLPLLSSAGDAKVDEAGAAMMANSTNIVQNGLFNLGAPTNGVAQNWTLTSAGGTGATTTASVVAASTVAAEAVGNAQKLDITFGSAGGFVTLASTNIVPRIPSINSTKLRAKARLSVVGAPVSLRNVRVELLGNGNVNPQAIWSFPDSANDIALPEGYSEIGYADIDLANWGVTALGGGMTVIFTISSTGAAGNAVVAFSEVSVDVV